MADHEERSGLVSIVIPCYNAEEYVGEAIESALRQTHEPKEIIVIDDGSTDGSLDVIRSFDERIVWRTGENRGACHARNWGLRLAQGSFVKFLDADDVLCKDSLGAQVGCIEKTNADTIVFGDAAVMNGVKEHMYDQPSVDNIISYLVNNNVLIGCPLHRKSLLCEVGGFNEVLTWAQEYELHIRLAVAGVRFVHISRVVYAYRDHEGETRIENKRGTYDSNPHLILQRNLNVLRSIDEFTGGNIPNELKRTFAQNTWGFGRAICRKRKNATAQKYFEKARELHGDCICGTRAYKIVTRALGPFVAERVSQARAKLKNSFV